METPPAPAWTSRPLFSSVNENRRPRPRPHRAVPAWRHRLGSQCIRGTGLSRSGQGGVAAGAMDGPAPADMEASSRQPGRPERPGDSRCCARCASSPCGPPTHFFSRSFARPLSLISHTPRGESPLSRPSRTMLFRAHWAALRQRGLSGPLANGS